MTNMKFSITGGLDREHNPSGEAYEVTAPYELSAFDAVLWALEKYGDSADSIECMGCWTGDVPSLGYVFRVAPLRSLT